jgi:glutamyl endopeptidase
MHGNKVLAAAVALVAGLTVSLAGAPAGAAAPDLAASGPDAPTTDGAPARLAPAQTGPHDGGPTVPSRPADPAAGLDLIIGADDRTRVNPTTTFPVRAIVQVVRDDGQTITGCSGWLYGASIVATAGHCVHPGSGQDGGGGSGYYPRDDFEIIPGRNGASRPFGTCRATQLMSVNGWTRDGNSEYDYGAIRLDCTAGNTTGIWGFWWQSASLVGTSTTVSGYPCDKPFGEQWRHAGGQVNVETERRIGFDNDIVDCQSGSPVYQQRAAGSAFCVGWCVMAITTGSTGGQNRGTRITESVFNNLVSWRG